MKLKKIIMVSTAFAMLAMSMAACGGGAENTTEAGTEAKTEAEVETEAESETEAEAETVEVTEEAPAVIEQTADEFVNSGAEE